MSNPAIRPQPNGDVDIAVSDEYMEELASDSAEKKPDPEASIAPENLDHPEEVMGE